MQHPTFNHFPAIETRELSPHNTGGHAITDCKLTDSFDPASEDFKLLWTIY